MLPSPPYNASPVCLCSPHPVKPLSVPVEGSPDRKQPRSSLSTALSSGLEKLKTVTSGSIHPVAPASQAGQTVDTKQLKVRPHRMPRGIRQDVLWREVRRLEVRNKALGRVEQGAGLVPDTRALKPGRPSLALETEAAPRACGGTAGVLVGRWACGQVGLRVPCSPHSIWPQDSGVLDQSAKYYHLTHDELIGLLLQRERELSQRDEHVQELESYIDRLLVRIMETSPTLLQIPPKPSK